MPRKKESTLSNCIRDLRTAKSGMTQQELADCVGVTRQTIVALEGGDYTPSLTLALRIARTFKKTTEQIFRLDE
jgi:putative transcriptional regulator